MTAMPADALPPYAQTMGIRILHAGDGARGPVLEMAFASGLSGRPGMLHGGAISGLLDMCASATLNHELRQRGVEPRFKPIGITIDFLRGGLKQPTFARGRVTRVGRRVATVMVEAWQADAADDQAPLAPTNGNIIAAARLHLRLGQDVAAEGDGE